VNETFAVDKEGTRSHDRGLDEGDWTEKRLLDHCDHRKCHDEREAGLDESHSFYRDGKIRASEGHVQKLWQPSEKVIADKSPL